MNQHVDIYFIRHSEPLIEAGTCYGQLDCDVNADYENQLAKVNHYFQDIEIDAIYSSPLQRCAKLAEDIAESQGDVSVNYLDSLKEIHFGDWEGVKWDDIPRASIDEWNNNRLHFKFPNGESPWEFIQRVLKAYSTLQGDSRYSQTGSNTLLVVTHAGVIRTLLASILSLTFAQSLNISLDKPSICHCSFNNDELESYVLNLTLSD